MRVLATCSTVLQLLLLLTLFGRAATDDRIAALMFKNCGAENTRCLVAKNCIRSSTELRLVIDPRIFEMHDNLCTNGVTIKARSRQEWHVISRWPDSETAEFTLNSVDGDNIVKTGETIKFFPISGVSKFTMKFGEKHLDVEFLDHETTHTEPNSFRQLFKGVIFTLSTKEPSIAGVLGLFRYKLIVCGNKNTEDCSKPFDFFANVCTDERLKDLCQSGDDNECKKIEYDTNKMLTCPDGYSLIIDNKEKGKTMVTCDNMGWKELGANTHFMKHHEQTKEIPVLCKHWCHADFRSGIVTTGMDTSTTNVYKCTAENDILKITNNAKVTANPIECTPKGWIEKGANGAVVLTPNEGATIKAECVNSCTKDFLQLDCTAGSSCVMPTIDAKSKIQCQPGFALYDGTMTASVEKDKYISGHIECTKQSFKGKVEIQRNPLSTTKLKVACVPACDSSFTEILPEATAAGKKLIKESSDSSGNRLLECQDTDHNIETEQGVQDEAIVCKAGEGWSKKSGGIIVDFKQNKFQLKGVTCADACEGRVNNICREERKFCKDATVQGNEVSCPKTHLMRVCTAVGNTPCSKGNDEGYVTLMSDSLICAGRKGMMKKSDLGGEPLIKFEPSTQSEKYGIECVEKCAQKFLTLSRANYHFPSKTLKCDKDIDVLEMKGKRVIAGDLKCDEDGWKNNNQLLVPFLPDSPETSAKCHEVCVDSQINDAFTGGDGWVKHDHMTEGQPLTCPAGTETVLYFNQKATTGAVKCEKKGWFESTTPLVDFTDMSVQLSDKVNVACIQLCNSKLIENACTGTHCSEFKLVSQKLTCEGSSAVAIYINDKLTKGDLKCTRDGWTEKNPDTEHVNFKTTPFAQLPVKVRIECRQLCNKEQITDGCDASDAKCTEHLVNPTYAASPSGATVTCDDAGHQLLFNDAPAAGPVTCSKDGWKQQGVPTPLVNFNQASTLPHNVKIQCRHKCDPFFVKDTCAGPELTEGKCSSINYGVNNDGKFELSCKHDTEVLMFKYDSDPEKYLYDLPATCDRVKGWSHVKDGTDTLIEDPAMGKYEVKVKCVQVCHPSTLNASPTGKRKYELGNILTCDDEKEMLKFNNVDMYADMKCTRKGWTTSGRKEPVDAMFYDFAVDGFPTTPIKVDCVENTCTVRPFVPCILDPNKICEMPNIAAVKYQMSCQKPLTIQGPNDEIKYNELYCKGGAWYSLGNKLEPIEPAAEKTKSLTLKCIAGQCSKCGNTLNQIPVTEANHVQLNFVPSSGDCVAYTCPKPYAFVKLNGGKREYYHNDDGSKKVKCTLHDEQNNKDEFQTPAGNKVQDSDQMGCVRQIPCTENQKLNTDCPELSVTCFPNLLGRLQRDEKPTRNDKTNVTVCNEGYTMYRNISVATNRPSNWQKMDSIQCQPNGKWQGMVDGGAISVEMEEHIICADSDPTLAVPEKPKDICVRCFAARKQMKCDECIVGRMDDFVRKIVDEGTCEATSTSGQVIYGDDNVYYGKITCKEGAELVWKTDEGELIGEEFAAKTGKPPAEFNKWIIVGIVIAVVCTVAAVGAVAAFVIHRRKQEASRLERLKSKGLEQKLDTIIDGASVVEDVKTIVL